MDSISGVVGYKVYCQNENNSKKAKQNKNNYSDKSDLRTSVEDNG